MRPTNLSTGIFLDSGDPAETRAILDLLGFLDGQTTNPTLIAKSPASQERLAKGNKFSKEEVFSFYRQVVTELSQLLPNGSVSIEVYADQETTSEQMLAQGKEMFSWIANAHIKYPTTPAGLEAAQKSVEQGMRINMTLCFSQEQAAAVYAASQGAKKGGAFVSPFIGRLVDRGERGIDLIDNIVKMYSQGDGHVEVLAASVRTLTDLMDCFALQADIVTAPFKVLKEWAEQGMPVPDSTYKVSQPENLTPITYQDIDLSQPWQKYSTAHELTEKGIEKFAADWNNLIS